MITGLTPEAAEIAFGGERVTHLYPNDVYFAHLSIYHFALPLAVRKKVFDAGCGSGYGSAYLARRGAKFVEAVDISPVAIAFNKKHFKKFNLRYRTMSLEQIKGFWPSSFDLIYSSNVLEHVPHVLNFFQSAVKLLKPNGTLLIAVPPVVDDVSRQNNVENPYHLNIWTPRQWFNVLSLFFGEVEPYYHTFENKDIVLDFGNSPEMTKVNETDFVFRRVALEEFYRRPPLTVVFIARKPFRRSQPVNEESLVFVEDSFTRPFICPYPVERVSKPPSPTIFSRGLQVLREEGFFSLMKSAVRFGFNKVVK